MISLLNKYSEVVECVTHGCMSHYLQNKFNPRQHGFLKTTTTAANLVTKF